MNKQNVAAVELPGADVHRRNAVRLLAGTGLAWITGMAWRARASTLMGAGTCVDANSVFSDGFEATSAASQFAGTGSCVLVPSETQGPYPLLSVLSDPEILRSDITEGLPGVPLTLRLQLVNVNAGCAPLSNVAVYLWHCDKDGVYSGYSQPGGINTTGEKFFRGMQSTDCDGVVTFQTVYPGWYIGRITHIHFQIYLEDGSLTATSQLAFPQDITQTVYASSLYTHGQNTSVTSFAQDNVFSDGTSQQMLTLTGSTAAGYVATITVGVSA